MIRAAAVVVALSASAAAEDLAGHEVCTAAWRQVSAQLASSVQIGGIISNIEDGWCVVENPVIDMAGQYVPDWHADRLRFRGSALNWVVDRTTAPERLELAVDGLRLVVQTGQPQFDWLYAAQAKANKTEVEVVLTWDPGARALHLETANFDFPGANRIELTALATGVDLSSSGAMQMSITSFALTRVDLQVQTHGLFEGYALMSAGPLLLPSEGDMDAAAKDLRAEITAGLADLPQTTFDAKSKAALAALIAELPNPKGVLSLSLSADPGFGPARLSGYAIKGVPDRLADAAALFDGVVVNIGWTHEDAP